jgi:hypothetical protein
MVIRIKKKCKRGKLDKALQKLNIGKKLDAKKFCGIIKWNDDGLAYQKRLRDEWD